MRAKQIAARQAKNRQIAETDALHRCVVCHRAFSETGQIVEDFCVPGKCCSDECLKALLGREAEIEQFKADGA